MSAPQVAEIVKLERRVWDALVRGDRAADEALLDGDFLGVYPTGFATRGEHAAQLRHGPAIAEFRIEQERLLVLRPDLVLLSYLAIFRRTQSAPATAPERAYVSSIWRAGPTGWRNVFSQDTNAA